MNQKKQSIWNSQSIMWGYIALTSILVITIFYSALVDMVGKWQSDEYSHAYILPFVIIYYFWQQKNTLGKIFVTNTWPGILLLALGILLYFSGELSSLYTLIQYGFIITLSGLIVILYGIEGFVVLWPIFVMLFFMVPLPSFFIVNLSSELQLISSNIGVSFIRLFDISVFLEGNVIDLGQIKLQVVDACSGLRYLFPLMALGFIATLFYKTALWKRIFIFISTIPITILMNSFRIGIIGVTVEFFGKQAAEGFLHDVEGWVIFMACSALLIFEMWIFTKIGKDRRPLSVVFDIEISSPTKSANTTKNIQQLSSVMVVSIIILLATTILSFSLSTRIESTIERKLFTNFPDKFGQWTGVSKAIKSIYLDELKLSDYLMVDYKNKEGNRVNLYSAYYKSQRTGESAHSPRTCMPGGGWRIQELNTIQLDNIRVNNKPLTVNRTLIQHGRHKQLVYYWFQQRGRVITNEYLVKWYLFWDSLTKNRTDGALLRLTILLPENKTDEYGDKILQDFMRNVTPLLSEYIPN